MEKELFFKIKSTYGSVFLEVTFDFKDLRMPGQSVESTDIEHFIWVKEKVITQMTEIQKGLYGCEETTKTSSFKPSILGSDSFDDSPTEDVISFPAVMPVKEFAGKKGVSLATVYSAIRSGILNSEPFGNLLGVTLDEVAENWKKRSRGKRKQ